MVSIAIGDLFRIIGTSSSVEIPITEVSIVDGILISFKGFTPLILPFNIDVVATPAGFRTACTNLPISFIPPSDD